MSLRIVATIVACASIVSVASGSGLKDFLKGVKDKAVETVQQQVPSQPEQPTTDQVPAEAARAVEAVKQAQPVEQPAEPVQQTSEPVQQTAPAQTKTAPNSSSTASAKTPAKTNASASGTSANGLWPNLAVDPAVVKAQQKEFGEQCRVKVGESRHYNCGCFEEKFPEARLAFVSEEMRRAQNQLKYGCPDGIDDCDSPAKDVWLWMSDPKTQKNWPTHEGEPAKKPRGAGPVSDKGMAFNLITTRVSKMCPGADPIYAARKEQECLGHTKSGMISLSPGTSSKAYCACYKDKLIEGTGESDAMISCRKS